MVGILSEPYFGWFSAPSKRIILLHLDPLNVLDPHSVFSLLWIVFIFNINEQTMKPLKIG